jgi:putative endonuclease
LTPHGHRLGKFGEERAAEYLQTLGYKIIGRNIKTCFGEIDIICRDRRKLLFVEVKTRASNRFGSAIEAISSRKKKQLKRLAEAYLQQNPSPLSIELALLAIDKSASGRWNIQLISFE